MGVVEKLWVIAEDIKCLEERVAEIRNKWKSWNGKTKLEEETRDEGSSKYTC